MIKENRHEIEIQGSVEKVWETLTNFDKYFEWNPLIYHVDGKLDVGEKVVISVGKAGREQKFICEVARLDPPHEFSWKFFEMMPFLYRGEHIFRVEPINEQMVRYVDRETFEGLLIPFKNVEKMKSGMISMGKALKEFIEKDK